MQSTTLEAILPTAAAYYGKSLSLRDGRQFCVDQINRVRGAWWKNKAMRRVLFQTTGCECVEHRRQDCNRACRTEFLAITLPPQVVKLDHVEFNGMKIPISPVPHSHPGRNWGGAGACRGRWEVELLTERSCTKREIPLNNRGNVIVKCVDAADKGKRAGIEYVTDGGVIIREDIELSINGYETKRRPLKILTLTFPPRCGFIIVLTADGFELGNYHPGVAAPRHLIVRVDGLSRCVRGAVIKWEGLAEPLPVVFNSDRVEVQNLVDWENAFQALDLHFKPNKTGSEQATLAASLQFDAASADSELDATQTVPAARLTPNGVKRYLSRMRWFESRYQRP